MSPLETVLLLAGVYLLLGLAFALPFCFRWVGRLDPLAAEAGLGLRLLLLPGSVALWPLLLAKLRRSPGGAGGEA